MTSDRKIVVTGAGGFIGGRVVEALVQHPEVGQVVPTVRRWGSLARIGRYPVEAAHCDVLEPGSLVSAVSGADAIVHCAVGGRAVTVEGTRNVLQAALTAGARRVIHVSTIDVYGRAEGTVTEDHPFERTGREYGDSKIEAEEACQEFVRHGLDVVILRPAIVYGPFSDLWTVQFAERLESGNWTLPAAACQGTCNLVYVDDLVRAILLAIDADVVPGSAYNVNGPDRITWQSYVVGLNSGLGLPPLDPPAESRTRLKTRLVEPFRKIVKSGYAAFEGPVQWTYKRSRPARTVIKSVQSLLRRVPAPAEYDLYGRVVDIQTLRAEAELGYTATVLASEGIERSVAWLRHEGAFGRVT